MKVAMYYNNKDVRIEEMPIPKIGDDELLVKVMASGICGSDVMEWYRIKKAPLVLGHEISGVVEKTGRNVKSFKKDDRVFVTHHVPCNKCDYCKNDQHTLCHTLHTTKFYPGGFAQYLRVPKINVETGTFHLPKNMSFDEGTFIEPLACVIRGFRTADFKSGHSFLILGSGIAGLLNLKMAKTLKPSRVFATDLEGYRLKMAEKMGADYVFNAKDNIPEKIRKNNDGKLADYVILCAGVPSAARQAVESVAPGGKILFFAPTKPGVDIDFPLFDLWNKQVSMFSTYAGAPVDIKKAIKLMADKKIKVTDLISHKLPMYKTPEGFKLMAEARDSMKIIIEPQK
jgi:L-iditol 2-dehydrogenase